MVSEGDTNISLHICLGAISIWGGDSGGVKMQNAKSWPNFHTGGGLGGRGVKEGG